MIHFTCDLCQRIIEPQTELRYVVKMEIYPAVDESEIEAFDDDEDHLDDLQEILQRVEHGEMDDFSEDSYKTLRYDLCPACREKFLKSPLPRELPKQFKFSKN